MSPTSASLDETWKDGSLVVLAHSREDELVEWEQVELMQKALKGQGWQEEVLENAGIQGGRKELLMLEVHGGHDEVWERGKEMARAIEICIQRVLAR